MTAYVDDFAIRRSAESDWEKSADLRKEFGGNFDSYYHFRRAEARGSVGIHRGPVKSATVTSPEPGARSSTPDLRRGYKLYG